MTLPTQSKKNHASPLVYEKRSQADEGDQNDQRRSQRRLKIPHPVLEIPVQLDDEPGGAEQRITHGQSEPAKYAERREPIEPTARISAMLDRYALNECPHHHALKKGRQKGTKRERRVPIPFGALGPEPEFERDPAQNQRQQHPDDGRVKGGKQHGVSQGKGGEKAAA
nr:hypothetical protein [Methylohalobius crimeensis]